MFARKLWTVGLLALGGCATTSAPEGYLRAPTRLQADAYGGWTEIRLVPIGDRPSQSHHGELLAVAPDTLYLLPAYRIDVLALVRTDVAEVRVTSFDARANELLGWGALGVLTTPTHGFGLILTAPAWAVATLFATTTQSRSAQRTYRPVRRGQLRYGLTGWENLQAYARFPQGMPPGYGRLLLTHKPHGR